jgi:hypothetical protein
MDARLNVRELPSTNASRQGKNQRLKIAGAILVLVLLLMVVVTYSPQIDSKATPLTTPQNEGRADATFVTDYFPAQFGSPRTNGVPEVHIQAF